MLDEVILKGARVLLRNVTVSDVNENYYRWMNDPVVNRYMETRFRPQSYEDIRSFVEKTAAAPDAVFLAILFRAQDRHIGNIKLGPISRVHKRGEISFFIGDQSLWHKGLATEAVSLLTDFGLNTLGLVKITAGCYSNNLGSVRVFEKCGYIREAVLQKHYLLDNTFVDRVCFAKFAGASEMKGEASGTPGAAPKR